MSVVLIAGSPNASSRSSAVLDLVERYLRSQNIDTRRYSVADFAAEELLLGQFGSANVQRLRRDIEKADGIVMATPVYKASFSGVLKTILDLLPQEALHDKVVLPIASGGSAGHLLVLDYALKPVLSAMKAQEILTGVFVQDSQIEFTSSSAPPQFEANLQRRIENAGAQLAHAVHERRAMTSQTQRLIANAI